MRQSDILLRTLVLCCLLALVPALIAADCKKRRNGCGRTPAKIPSTTPDSITAPPTTTPVFESHRTPCTASELQRIGCLNGGSCVVIVLNKTRTPFCMCPKYYDGTRCEELSPEIFGEYTAQGRVVTAGVAAGVVVFLLLVTIFTAYAVIKIRKKRARSVEVNGRSANGPCHESLLTNCNTMTGHADDVVTKEYHDNYEQQQRSNNRETDV